MRLNRQRVRLTVLAASLLALGLMPSFAAASASQVAMFQPGTSLVTNPGGTMDEMRSLGVGVVRVILPWASIAPDASSTARPSHFKASDPAQYPASNWSIYDTILREAARVGIRVDLTVSGGSPLWADAGPIPAGARTPLYAWKPRATEYEAFVHAVGVRYSGHYVPAAPMAPLPRVDLWGIWNEPNFGKNLDPQATSGSTVATAAVLYRALVDAGWSGLGSSGHGRDQILIGALAARGTSARPTRKVPEGRPGTFGTTKPLGFIRALYCVDSRYRALRGRAARAIDCSGSTASFRRGHPGLFAASGFADHPYPLTLAPNRPSSNDPDYTEFSQLPRLASVLDRLQRLYGSRRRFPIWVTEYAYITNPPNHSLPFVSPSTAAKYINWAEYLSYKNSRIANTMQFLLEDPNPSVGVPEFGGFASGLEFFGGRHKPSYEAYRMPLFLPVTSARRNHAVEVWGCVRPAHDAQLATHRPQSVTIQFQRGSRGAFTSLRTVRITSPRGYFDVHVTFPASGSVRLQWSGTSTFHSRTERLALR